MLIVTRGLRNRVRRMSGRGLIGGTDGVVVVVVGLLDGGMRGVAFFVLGLFFGRGLWL